MADSPAAFNFPTEFPYEFESFGSNLDLGSPVESVGSSTETDSIDEDDFFAGLTQQLAWCSLYETEKSASPCLIPSKIEKSCIKFSSPQSTLSGIDYWFPPNSPSQFQSPPMAENAAKELITAAAMLKLRGETTPNHANPHLNRGLLGCRSSVPVESTNTGDYALFSNQCSTRHPVFAAQMQRVRQELVLQALCASSWARQSKASWPTQQPLKQEIQNRGRSIGHGSSPIGFYRQSAWLPPPSLRQNQQPLQNGSATRSAHLAGSGVKRAASSGTGVFLPRRYVNPSECRQKLQHSFQLGYTAIHYPEEIKSPIESPFNGCAAPGFDDILARRKPLLPVQSNFRPEAAINHELHLPQEWTY